MNKPTQTSIFRQESLERLSSPEQLDQLMQIVSPKSWLPLITLGSLIFMALLWSVLGRIPVTATGRGLLVQPSQQSEELMSLSYFKPGEGARIQPGMEIIVVPASFGSEQVEGIRAEVTEVADPAVMTLDMARQMFTTNAVPLEEGSIEVIARLQQGESGYNWMMTESQMQLSPGLPTTNRIILEQKAPITFIFPFLNL
jgi:hypothetical protein